MRCWRRVWLWLLPVAGRLRVECVEERLTLDPARLERDMDEIEGSSSPPICCLAVADVVGATPEVGLKRNIYDRLV